MAYIQRVQLDKMLKTELSHIERLKRSEMLDRRMALKEVNDKSFQHNMKTREINPEKAVIDRFLDKMLEEKRRLNVKTPPLDAKEPSFNQRGNDQNGFQFNVFDSYSDKRLKTILPRLVKHREQLLQSTLMGLDDYLMETIASRQATRTIEAIKMQIKEKAETELHTEPVALEPIKVEKVEKAVSKPPVHYREIRRNAMADLLDVVEMEQQERERIDRLNLLRLMAGMTAIAPPEGGADWNKYGVNNAKKKADEKVEEQAVEGDGDYDKDQGPDLRAPLPFKLPKLVKKKKEKVKITHEVPLALKMLFRRYQLQHGKLEEHCKFALI